METARLEEAYRTNERYLWGILYRLLGSAEDADDIVQDTFVRAMERPPADLERALRPWLVRVGLNLGRDRLRRRQLEPYTGVWLPSPVDDAPGWESAGYEPAPDARYEMAESVTFAFLLALEALTPKQRAVLLLRDVFDYSTRETADALDVTEGDVKTTLHRARASMDSYDHRRCRPDAARRARTEEALGRFLAALAMRDVGAIEALLAEDVRAISDGGGVYRAAGIPVLGRAKVALFYARLNQQRAAQGVIVEPRLLNGLPGIVISVPNAGPGESPHIAMSIDVDDDGRIREIRAQMAPDKLTRLRFPRDEDAE